MEKLYYIAKEHITHFKLEYCCWYAPVTVGLLCVGYINIIIDLVFMISISNDGFSPTLARVQETLIEGNLTKPIPMLAYTSELGFNVLLLCAVHRRDLVLLHVFLYYTLMAVVMSITIYSIVIAALPFYIQLAIIVSILFQIYDILIIRSVILEWKMEKKKAQPKLVMSSLLKDRGTLFICDPKNAKIQKITIAEVPKKQEVQTTMLCRDEKVKQQNSIEIKDAEVKSDTDVELKKGAGVKIEIESKEVTDEKKRKKEKKEHEKMISLILQKYKEDKDAEEAKIRKFKKTILKTVYEHPKE